MTRFLNFEEFYYMLQGYEENPSAKWNDIFNKLFKLFNGSTLNCYKKDEQDPTQPVYLKAYYTNFDNLLEDILAKNGHRYIYKKFEGNTTKRIPSFDSNGNLQLTEQHVSDLDSFLDIELFVKRMINGWVERNGDRVIRTLSASELDYNPIENYDRAEDTDETSTGSKTMTREMADDYNPMEFSINAPILNIDAEISHDAAAVTSLALANKVSITTQGAGASSSDTENGKTLGTASVTESADTITASVTSSGTGKDVKTTEQVATYDSNSLHNNRETKSEGDIANSSVSSAFSKTDQYGSVTLTKNNPERYTDTEAYDNFGTNRNGRIHGNIGVTTTQQMIEQEYNLRNKRLVDDFISECMNEVFLQCGA